MTCQCGRDPCLHLLCESNSEEGFLLLFCEKNSDGTKKLRLKGKELQQRFNSRIEGSYLQRISAFINHHPEINELNLSYNNIGDEGLNFFTFIVLSAPNKIEHLNLMHCDLTEEGLKNLFITTEECYTRLKTLRLSGNDLGPVGGHMVALCVRNCPQLEYLDVGDTSQTPESIDSIFIELYNSKIKILNVSRAVPRTCALQVDESLVAEGMSELLRINRTLVELHVQKCALDAHAMDVIVEGLRSNESLRFLDVGYNNLCCPGAERLAAWLETKPPLLALNIAGNAIKNHGGVALSFGLPFSKVRMLDITDNRIGDEGMIAILQTIKKTYMLRYFYLWGNPLGQRTLKIIERMLISTVLRPTCIDIKLYTVDGQLCAARYPADHYKHRYYDVMDYGCAVELKIKRNIVDHEYDRPKAIINFKHVDRFPERNKCYICSYECFPYKSPRNKLK